jgi:hypothetical protein
MDSVVVFANYFTDYDSIRCGLQKRGYQGVIKVSQVARQKNAGLKAATLISVSNPVSQVLW